jgi:hypothetical protein
MNCDHQTTEAVGLEYKFVKTNFLTPTPKKLTPLPYHEDQIGSHGLMYM